MSRGKSLTLKSGPKSRATRPASKFGNPGKAQSLQTFRMLDLPVEMHFCILQRLSTTDLRHCAAASRILLPTAYAFLFRDVWIPFPAHIRKLLACIRARPLIAAAIRRLDIYAHRDTGGHPTSICAPELRDLLSCLHQVHMLSLANLSWHDVPPANQAAIFRIARNVRVLILLDVGFYDSSQFVHFISAFRDLHVLRLTQVHLERTKTCATSCVVECRPFPPFFLSLLIGARHVESKLAAIRALLPFLHDDTFVKLVMELREFHGFNPFRRTVVNEILPLLGSRLDGLSMDVAKQPVLTGCSWLIQPLIVHASNLTNLYIALPTPRFFTHLVDMLDGRRLPQVRQLVVNYAEEPLWISDDDTDNYPAPWLQTFIKLRDCFVLNHLALFSITMNDPRSFAYWQGLRWRLKVSRFTEATRATKDKRQFAARIPWGNTVGIHPDDLVHHELWDLSGLSDFRRQLRSDSCSCGQSGPLMLFDNALKKRRRSFDTPKLTLVDSCCLNGPIGE